MRLEFVRTFVDATTEMFGRLVGDGVEISGLAMRPSPEVSSEVMSVIGLTGAVHGRVIFDMSAETAVNVAGCMMGAASQGLTPLVRSSIAELSSIAVGRAISMINDSGTRIHMSPPTVITGANLASYDQCLETLIAPIRTACGEVRLNIMVQDLD